MCHQNEKDMSANIESTIRIIHILSGAIAMFSGIAALLFSKQVKNHRPLGKVFAYAMTSVFGTALYMAITKGIDFLLCIAILSFFSVIVGVRSLKFLKGAKPGAFDWAAVVGIIGAGLFLVIKGSLAGLTNFSGGVVLYLVFGTAMVIYGFLIASEFIRIKPGAAKWFRLHQSNMGAALIATLTAFCTTVLHELPSITEWILPSIIFSPLLSYYIRKSNKVAVKA